MAAQSNSKILLQGGTLLIHDANNHVVPTVSDLLVEGSTIAKIAEHIKPDAETKVVNCEGKIVSPGFIDTHRHLYQTQAKGKHANQTLMGYMASGPFAAVLYSADDLFWGQLAGAMESIDAGTTTVVDHSSCNSKPEHPIAAIQALLTSGLRTIYCYNPPRTVSSWDPWKSEDDYFSEETKSAFQDLALAAPFDGRVYMGYAVDNIYLPADVIKPFYADLRDPAKGKAKLITTHGMGGPMMGGAPSAAQMLSMHSLLGPDILISHANFPHKGDGELYAKSGAHVSSTPSTELQMGWPPVALREDFSAQASLGVDCHSLTSASLPAQMNLILQYARCKRQEELAEGGMWSRQTGFNIEQVFNLGTICGAKAVGLENEVGKLGEGMKADLVVFDGTSPTMLAVVEEDPVAAIVLHSGPRDIDMVLVDGIIRKEEAKLVDLTVQADPLGGKGIVEVGKTVKWKDVTENISKSKRVLDKKRDKIDMKQGEEYIMDLFHVNRKGLLEEQKV
ncbi:MAG: hypothetical protein M1819_005465 [Sarea resinae]|nr:MAG: hypothetical protein M1819_005465 [Sarea resinae]